MSCLRSVQIQIPDPCSEHWDNMTPDEAGRFCAHCQKTVIDFSNWSDTAVYNFFSKNTGDVCGRFFSTQLNRSISIPHQPHSRLYRITMALGLTLLFTQSPALAQNKPPMTQQTDLVGIPIIKAKDTVGCIKGQVLDEKKEPMVNAVVQVFQNGILKGGAVADFDGNYEIKPLVAGKYDVMVSYARYYDSITTKDVIIPEHMAVIRNFSMSLKKGCIQDPVIVYRYGLPAIITDNPPRKVPDRDTIKHEHK